jgi:RHS repeat-associated protein
LNTPQKLTDSTQGIVWDRDQQPFGETVAIAYPAVSPPLTSLVYDAQHRFDFTVLGDTNYSYVVEAVGSLNTPNWQPLTTNTGVFGVVDSGAANYPARFYRVISSAPVVTENLRFPGQYYDTESGLNYNMMRDYDPTLGRYIQSDPIGLRGGNNLYAYAGSTPLKFIDMYGLVVYVGEHGAFFGWVPANHTAIVLVPDNPSDFANSPIPSTLGGQPFGSWSQSASIVWGNLQSSPDNPGDSPGTLCKPGPLQNLTPVPTPPGMTDTQFINALINAANAYNNDEPYDPFPDPFDVDRDYNSNSYTSGVIEKAGGIPPNLPGFVPGYNQPLPIP